SALCMAIFYKGMTDRETADLTMSMARSGDTVDLSEFGDLSADKHSTGGVGDKTTLIVAPIVAALGAKVAKMSGRGLGHTGGTVDKLEAIPGYRTSLSPEEFMEQSRTVGACVISQTGNLTPADKKLYALRDVTATVDSIPLITSSVMSKKLAAGAKNIVLDVKCGSGAFMKTPDDAKKLAKNMVDIGKSCGRNVVALITDMDAPLGKAIGNSLEVAEAARLLKTGEDCDLMRVSMALASNMIALVKKISVGEALALVKECVRSGAAFEKMKQWISSQGGDSACLDDPSLLPQARLSVPVTSPSDGYIGSMDAQAIGSAAMILGAGRASKNDVIDPAAGIVLEKKTGDRVKKGETLCTLYTNRENSVEEAKNVFLAALSFTAEKPEIRPLVLGRVE
ncbi:MAG: thymidine phosphorylase, partial [Clostridia bacterium]|nr:thymidine phosphorylase [Clostridia bacterium]